MSDKLTVVKPAQITHFDPDAALKMVAASEAIEKYAKRAKDADMLLRAVEAKLTAQREFVLWWDGQGFNKPGPLAGDRNRSVTISIPDKMTLSRWRKKLATQAAFDKTIAAAQEKCIKTCELGKAREGDLLATDSNEWYTPHRYIDAARAVLGGFDLDPASCAAANKIVKADHIFTREDNGLKREWFGRVWLNPPYGGLQADFTFKLLSEFEAGRVNSAVILVNSNSTDTDWFSGLFDFPLCFTDHRIDFIPGPGSSEESSSTHGSVFAYLGQDVAAFNEEFKSLGNVVVRFKP